MEQDAAVKATQDATPLKIKQKRALLKWSLVGTAVLFAYFAWQCGSGMTAGARLSDGAVQRFHEELNSKDFDGLIDESDAAFQGSANREDLLRFLGAVHAKLGNALSSTRDNIFVNVGTNGTTIRTTYQTGFSNGHAVEVFLWRRKGNQLKLVGYNIQSQAFLQ